MIKIYRPKVDFWLGLIVFGLCLLGLLMITSASSVVAYERFGNPYYYVVRQIIYLVIGFILMVILANVDYRFWRKPAFFFLVFNILLLILVFVPYVGTNIGGAHRWLHIGPSLFQPSELLKLILVIYLAFWFEKRQENVRSITRGFIPLLFLLTVIIALIMLQPDMGTTVVIFATAALMFFIAGASWLEISIGAILSGIVFWIFIFSSSYRWQRFLTYINLGREVTGAAYHINQALLAIGSGGWWGLGFGQSRQKYLYLPQAHSDSIFAIIGEELGFLRAGVILVLYLFLGLRGFRIAQRAPDNFGKFLAFGITSWLLIQTFINLAAMLGLLPLTGVPLPFLSAGGSSLIVSLAGVGILLNISRYSEAR